MIARTPSHSLTHLADHVLLRDLATLVAQDRTTTAAMLAHLAEVDARKLFLPKGYSSMFDFCVNDLRFSEESAYKRIQAARVAQRFPEIFPAVARGEVHLSAIVLLAPHLTAETAQDLLAAAASKTCAAVKQMLAERFPQPDMPTCLAPVVMTKSELQTNQTSPCEREAQLDLNPVGTLEPQELTAGVCEILNQGASAHADSPAARAKVAPLSPGRFALQLTVVQATHDKLRYAQALLGHAVPSGDISQVLDRALDALIHRLEQRKFAACARSRPGKPRRSSDGRHVPAAVRREVWQRDQGQCTFVSESGHRCTSCTRLEFDHIDPVARGGQASVDRMRLRCRTHNQYAAERVYGAGFMQRKRDEARRAAAAKREAREAREPRPAHPTRARPGHVPGVTHIPLDRRE